MNIFDIMHLQIEDTVSSESGDFSVRQGIVYAFTPHSDNVIEGGINAPQAHTGEMIHYDNAIKHLIVPECVKGVADGFLRGWAITESVAFPDFLESIGTEEGSMNGGAFSRCYLPGIVLSQSIKTIGKYAFGGSYIKTLLIHPGVMSIYNRQFKDSTIERLFLSRKTQEMIKNFERLWNRGSFYANFEIHCNCKEIEF